MTRKQRVQHQTTNNRRKKNTKKTTTHKQANNNYKKSEYDVRDRDRTLEENIRTLTREKSVALRNEICNKRNCAHSFNRYNTKKAHRTKTMWKRYAFSRIWNAKGLYIEIFRNKTFINIKHEQHVYFSDGFENVHKSLMRAMQPDWVCVWVFKCTQHLHVIQAAHEFEYCAHFPIWAYSARCLFFLSLRSLVVLGLVIFDRHTINKLSWKFLHVFSLLSCFFCFLDQKTTDSAKSIQLKSIHTHTEFALSILPFFRAQFRSFDSKNLKNTNNKTIDAKKR